MFRPDIFDDGSLSEQPFKKIKAFTDVGNMESMSKERWGAAKWMKGQPRLYCVNDFDASQEPEDDMPIVAKRAGQVSFITHSQFMKMLEAAWYAKEVNESNIMAVLKRTHILIITKTFLYIRPAGEDKQPVLRKPLNEKSRAWSTTSIAKEGPPCQRTLRRSSSGRRSGWKGLWLARRTCRCDPL